MKPKGTSHQVKSPKTTYLLIAAGFALGGISMAGINSGIGVAKAVAETKFSPRIISATSAESLAELHNLDESFKNLAKFVGPAVVDIKSTSGRMLTSDGRRMPTSGGEGSGFIFRSDGYVLTNDHVVGGFDKVKVILKDGREFEGKVTRAEDSDLALVKIDAKDLPTLAFGDSNLVEPGQLSMAVGAPFGLVNSVTVGHISALARDKTVIQDRLYPDLIQTDTAINMGNSGGPLVNVDGQVIGINTAIYSPTGTSAGIGFAIPSNQAKFITDLLVKDGKITRSMLGLVPENLTEYQKLQKKVAGGALVQDVMGEPAKSAGILKDDIVTRIGKSAITQQIDLRNAMLIYRPGSTVPVEVIRDGKKLTLDVTLLPYSRPKTVADMSPGQNGLPKGFQLPPNMNPFDEIPGMPNTQEPPQSGSPDSEVPPVREGKAKLGVGVQDLSANLRTTYNIPSNATGVLVMTIEPGSVADRMGIQAGDLIQALGDKTTDSAKALSLAMSEVKWGDTRRVKFSRFGKNSRASSDATVTFR